MNGNSVYYYGKNNYTNWKVILSVFSNSDGEVSETLCFEQQNSMENQTGRQKNFEWSYSTHGKLNNGVFVHKNPMSTSANGVPRISGKIKIIATIRIPVSHLNWDLDGGDLTNDDVKEVILTWLKGNGCSLQKTIIQQYKKCLEKLRNYILKYCTHKFFNYL